MANIKEGLPIHTGFVGLDYYGIWSAAQITKALSCYFDHEILPWAGTLLESGFRPSFGQLKNHKKTKSTNSLLDTNYKRTPYTTEFTWPAFNTRKWLKKIEKMAEKDWEFTAYISYLLLFYHNASFKIQYLGYPRCKMSDVSIESRVCEILGFVGTTKSPTHQANLIPTTHTFSWNLKIHLNFILEIHAV